MTFARPPVKTWTIFCLHTGQIAFYRIYTLDPRLGIWYLAGAFDILDVYTNFISGIMCYRQFQGHYNFCCGCTDRRCRICWMKIINKQTEDTMNLERTITNTATAQNPSGSNELPLETIASSSNTDKSGTVEIEI